MLTLTIAEIRDLASFAGLHIATPPADDGFEQETEITVTACPATGIKNDGEPSDPAVSHYKHIAYLTHQQEEGCVGLGDEIDAPPNGGV